MTLLTVVVPCYNAEGYMSRAVDSLLTLSESEVIIVDDGSTDRTSEIADSYSRRHPKQVRVVHKQNGGHGSAINAGLELARGKYFKVLDADDWLDPYASHQLLGLLQRWECRGTEADLIVTNFVYEKQQKRHKRTVRYAKELPVDQLFGWGRVRPFLPWKYLLMHSMLYRTDILRKSGLKLPEHSFYVDNLFAFEPLPHVEKLYYLDVDLYRYWIGRDDQSVNVRVMTRRIDQQLAVNKRMFTTFSHETRTSDLPPNLYRYMLHYLQLITLVSTTLCKLDGSPALSNKERKLWSWMMRTDARLCSYIRRFPVGWAARRSKPITRFSYKVARALIGFN